MMLLTLWANQSRVERAERRGRAEGRTEENRRWREYLGRREAAERAGLAFDEPMPEPPEDGRSGG